MKFYTKEEPLFGGTIDCYAAKLLAEADAAQEMRVALFNECPVIAFPGDTSERVSARWEELFAEGCKAYERSLLGIQRRAEARERERKSRKVAVEFIADMAAADLASYRTALAFVKRSNCVGWVYTTDLAKQFVELLRDAGYEANVNCGENFREDDPENYARYIIGQAMTMPGHGIEGTFCERWEKRFGETLTCPGHGARETP